MSASPRGCWAVVPAAGVGARFSPSGERAASHRKQYAHIAGSPVIEWALRPLLDEPRIRHIVVAVAADDEIWPDLSRRLQSARPAWNQKLSSVGGGATRSASVRNALDSLPPDAEDDWVLVHDAARPCLAQSDLIRLLDAADEIDRLAAQQGHEPLEARGAVLGARVRDTLRREEAGSTITVDRSGVWRALTPQAFRCGELRAALASAQADGVNVTDEAQALERNGGRIRMIEASGLNMKVTTPEDLTDAAQLLGRAHGGTVRIGHGFDVHAFTAGDHVKLGGVRIAHDRAVLAHSDGDVILHALCDAILGALGQSDIGHLFPDSDPRYANADSRLFLRAMAERVRAAGYRLVNADITVSAQSPRIAPHREAMVSNIADDLDVPRTSVNVKATTTEGLGFIGRGEGLSATAVVLLSAQS